MKPINFINLTPHSINIPTDAGNLEIPASGEEARIEMHYNAYQILETDGHRIGLETFRQGAIVGLPEPQPDKYYIVSNMVAQRANRKDVICPGRLIRDENKRVIGCEGLLVPETATNTHGDGSLTPEILKLDSEGMRQVDIAKQLGISRQAVSDALKRHRQKTAFSDDDLCLIADALNGVRYTDGIPHTFYLISNIVDAIEIDGIDQKWEVDRVAISAKLKALTENDAKTLHERVEAFWDASPHDDMIAGLRAVGL